MRAEAAEASSAAEQAGAERSGARREQAAALEELRAEEGRYAHAERRVSCLEAKLDATQCVLAEAQSRHAAERENQRLARSTLSNEVRRLAAPRLFN